MKDNFWIEELKALTGHLQAGNKTIFFGNDLTGEFHLGRNDGFRSDITPSDILLQGLLDQLFQSRH